MPRVAPAAVLITPARTIKTRIFLVRLKTLTPWAQRANNVAARSASAVLPAAIPIAVQIDPCVAKFTRNAPSRMPGQSLKPQTRIAASAIPLDGQTAEALGLLKARDKPKIPAQK